MRSPSTWASRLSPVRTARCEASKRTSPGRAPAGPCAGQLMRNPRRDAASTTLTYLEWFRFVTVIGPARAGWTVRTKNRPNTAQRRPAGSILWISSGARIRARRRGFRSGRVRQELRLALVWRQRSQHHVDVASDELRVRVRMPHVHKLRDGALDDIESDLRMRHLAAAKLEAQLHLVAVRQKFLGVAEFRVEIVHLDARAEFDLLDLAGGRLRMGMLLLLFIDVLAEVHDPADGGLGVRRHLDQVKTDQIGR